MFNMVLWIYHRVCMFFEYVKDTEGSEYAWACSWIMLEYVWTYIPEAEPKITMQAK